jgi:cobalt-zinc-cadmium efflux system protein
VHEHLHHHDHLHDHGDDRGHATDHERNAGHLKVSIALNLGFALIEALIGLLANSMAILSDAAHDFMDSASLLLSLVASWVSQRPPDAKRTFGYRRASILAALLNSSVLVITSVVIGFHAIRRLFAPAEVQSTYMLIVAALSIAVNGYAVLRMRHDRHGDLNLESAFIHLLEDALGGIGLLAGGLLIRLTGWHWIDSVVALTLSAIVLRGALRIVLKSLNIFMEGTPEDLDVSAIENAILGHPMVEEVHHIHVWTLDASHYSMSVHVRLRDRRLPSGLYEELAELVKPFKVAHLTVQAEGPEGTCLPCN